MKRFEIQGTFEAESIDDAFAWLALHFAHLADENAPEPEERLRDLAITPRPFSPSPPVNPRASPS